MCENLKCVWDAKMKGKREGTYSFGHSDALEDGNAGVWLEKLVDGLKVRLEPFAADGFKHLDADNLVVEAVARHGQGTIVAKNDFNVVSQTGFRNALLGQGLLFLAQRD